MRKNHKKPAATRNANAKIRKCLMCRAEFNSAWNGERICRRCKSSATWQGGSMG